jgi:hypothetical protein
VKHAAMDRKLPTNTQFWTEMLSAETAMVEVLAVSSVKVGRLVPRPRPMMATPAMFHAMAVAEEMFSA